MDEVLPGHWVDRRADAPGVVYAPPRAGWLRDAVALAEALFEDEHGPPPPERLHWLAHELADYVEHIGARSKLVIRGSFLAIAAMAPILGGKPLRALERHARGALIEKLERSPLALSVLAVRASLCILWYEHPVNARLLGLRPRPAPPRPGTRGAS